MKNYTISSNEARSLAKDLLRAAEKSDLHGVDYVNISFMSMGILTLTVSQAVYGIGFVSEEPESNEVSEDLNYSKEIIDGTDGEKIRFTN